MLYRTEEFTRKPVAPEDVSASTLLGVSFSLKPAPGRQGRSAARSMLCRVMRVVANAYSDCLLLDLRDQTLPFFDGRMPHEQDAPALKFAWSCINRAGALLLSVPAYWSGVSGVFKNFVDVLCGPVYDMDSDAVTVFAGKPVGLLIVGADDASAQAGSDQARQILLSTGARLVGTPVVISNPRSSTVEDLELASHELIALGAELAKEAYLRGGIRPAPTHPKTS